MKIPLFDGHCDTLYRLAGHPGERLAGAKGQWDLNRAEQLFAPQAQFFAVFADSAEPNWQEQVRREFDAFRRQCALHSDRVAPCANMDEAEKAWSEGKVAVFLSVEGAELIGCSLEGLEWAYTQGVRVVNLTWNHANALSGSNVEERSRGLSPLGRAYVRKMGELGMLTDVSHLSDPGFWDVMEWASGSVIATHSNSRAVFSHTRNLTDEQFTAIMKKHGVVGLNVYTAFLGRAPVTQEHLLAHLEHFLALGGEDAVGLGGDWDGCDSLPQGYTGIWNWSNFYELLLRRNYSEELVQKLFFYNMKRTVGEGLSPQIGGGAV